MVAGGQHDVGSSIERPQHRLGHEEPQVVEVGRSGCLYHVQYVAPGLWLTCHIAHRQAQLVGTGQDLGAVRLNAPPERKGHGLSQRLEPGRGFDARQPAFRRIEAAHLEKKHVVIRRQGLAHGGHGLRVHRFQQVGGDAVGYDQRIQPQAAHQLPHVATDSAQRGHEIQAFPIHPMESHCVIRVPEQDGLLPQSSRVEQVAEPAERLGCVPLLGQHDQAPTLGNSRLGNLLDDKGGRRRGEIPPLALFTIVHTQRVVMADPLAPAVQQQPSVHLLLDPWQVRVPYKEEVSLKPTPRQCAAQLGDPHTKPTGLGVSVWPLER